MATKAKTTKENKEVVVKKTYEFLCKKEYFNKEVGKDVMILDRFKLCTRKSLNSSWIIVYDKYTDKILLLPGTRKHLCFMDSDEAMKYLRKTYIVPKDFEKFHLIEEYSDGFGMDYGSRGEMVKVIPKQEYEEMVQKLNSLQKAVDGFVDGLVREKIEKEMKGDES